MSKFPEDIIFDILKRLPVKPIIRFKCVSKYWCNLIKNPDFVKLHFNRSLEYGEPGVFYPCDGQVCCVDYDSSSSTFSDKVAHIDFPLEHKTEHILGSCNGLLCFISYQGDIIIWNPYTKDYKKVPTPSTKMEIFFARYAFGYDLKTEDYTLALMENNQRNSADIMVYSLKSNSWSIGKRDIPCLFDYDDLVFFEGSLHWIQMPEDRWNSENLATIGSFDIGSKAFKEIPLPQHFSRNFNRIYVRLLGGCLYLIGSSYMTPHSDEVWRMEDYGVHKSWTKFFATDKAKHSVIGHLDLRQIYRSGMILTQDKDFNIYLHNPNQEEPTEHNTDGIPPGFKTWTFFGSLVSPNLAT